MRTGLSSPALTVLCTLAVTVSCSCCFSVKAVYDVTLNFKDKENPTLLGIINGKKYKADMSVRSVPHVCKCPLQMGLKMAA